jgi:hypothetical protein
MDPSWITKEQNYTAAAEIIAVLRDAGPRWWDALVLVVKVAIECPERFGLDPGAITSGIVKSDGMAAPGVS